MKIEMDEQQIKEAIAQWLERKTTLVNGNSVASIVSAGVVDASHKKRMGTLVSIVIIVE